ncbi:Ubiquitin carboxyl-terminal hydrolase 30 [Trichinella nativa]|uniref:Ubiquitin carboxyl-terminal hydrolase n=1 Tax=Trichinella nativa TaxID=6335 RepID=A0A0V1KRF9_9BILA|nr:Ubiquitin carboxyl-terminal hydrolase 30 [Trichinella nativa]
MFCSFLLTAHLNMKLDMRVIKTMDRQCLMIVGTVTAASIIALALFFFMDSKERKRLRKVPGLYNYGSVCFVNSLLQSLASCSSFVSWSAQFSNNEEYCFLKALGIILQELNDHSKYALSSQIIINSLKQRGWNLETNIQQDVHELLNVFDSAWDEELSPLFKTVDINSDAREAIQVPSHGKIRSETVCHACSHKTSNLEDFGAVTLNFPTNINMPSISLEECLLCYMKPECLLDAICENCSSVTGNVKMYKTLKFEIHPKCFIFIFQRLMWLPSGMSFKIATVVNLPELLDLQHLAEIVRHPKADQSTLPSNPSLRSCNDKLYRLEAVIVHRGNHQYGHFITYRRDIDNQSLWCAVSDDEVKPIQFDSVASCQAYMAFYEKAKIESNSEH